MAPPSCRPCIAFVNTPVPTPGTITHTTSASSETPAAARLPGLPDVLGALERGTLAPHAFDHRAHVFAAWAAMRQYGLEEGATRFRHALRCYCGHLKADDKYHVTITEALLQLIALYLPDDAGQHLRWQQQWRRFEQRAAGLMLSSRDALSHHYSEALLAQESSRQVFIAPDRQPLAAR